MKHCSVDNCTNKYYAKSFCKKHYTAYITRGGYKIKKCDIDGCDNTTKEMYCKKHKFRIEKGYSLDLSIKAMASGSNHYRWNGGTSVYKNQWEFTNNRKIKMNMFGGMCERCGNKGRIAHHKDLGKTDHSIENLEILCDSCHIKIHRKPNIGKTYTKTSKYIRLYGMTLTQMSEKFGESINYYFWMHKAGVLDSILKKIEISV